MKDKKKDDIIEEINKILSKTSQNNVEGCYNFANGISVKRNEIENIINRTDRLLTELSHGGICEECAMNNEDDCENCALGLKKKELYRVFKIIKGDWPSDHE